MSKVIPPGNRPHMTKRKYKAMDTYKRYMRGIKQIPFDFSRMMSDRDQLASADKEIDHFVGADKMV